MIGYLLSIFLVIAAADSDCSSGINSRVVKRGENVTFSIEHDTNSGKEYEVFVDLNNTSSAQLTCLNVNCKLDSKTHGSLIDYKDGILTINSSILDGGICIFRYIGHSLSKNQTEKCFNVTVIDDDNLPSTISPDPPSTTPAVSSVGSRSDPSSTISLEHLQITWGIAVVIAVGIAVSSFFVINWMWKKKKQNSSDADVGAGDSGMNNLLQASVKRNHKKELDIEMRGSMV